tara:strand:- start:323 stop:571 length:249 start_codon:yes stop_codon:yes gene_type:complete
MAVTLIKGIPKIAVKGWKKVKVYPEGKTSFKKVGIDFKEIKKGEQHHGPTYSTDEGKTGYMYKPKSGKKSKKTKIYMDPKDK